MTPDGYHASAWLLGTAILAAAAAGQDQQQAKQVAAEPPRTATYFAGWLEEVVSSDAPRAIAIYEEVARNPRVSPEQRGQSLLRLIQMHALRADDAALEALLVQLPQDVREQVEDQVIARIPPEVLELGAAVREGKEEDLDTLRARAEDRLLDNRSRLFWRRPAGLDTLELDPTPGRRTASPLEGELRLQVPLVATGWTSQVRTRAGQIASLRLRNKHTQADLLEADVVERLRKAGRTRDLGADTSVDIPADQTTTRLATARQRLNQAIAGPLATAQDIATMTRVVERIDELEEAGQPGAAIELLAALPFRGLLDTEPANGDPVDDHGR